jgi:hypothetical protein
MGRIGDGADYRWSLAVLGRGGELAKSGRRGCPRPSDKPLLSIDGRSGIVVKVGNAAS